MTDSIKPYARVLRDLATLMVAAAGESVSMVKRAAPEQALKLNKRKEWDVYLEFLKVMFNLADRVTAMYIPIKDQPIFMDSLEDAVVTQLKTVLGPTLGADTDQMEIVVSVGQAVAESRRRYESFKFVATDEGPQKEAYFAAFGERIATLIDAPKNGQVIASATLCAGAVIPAMKSALDAFGQVSTAGEPGASGRSESTPSAMAPSEDTSGFQPGPQAPEREIKLVSVMASVAGEEVETRWGLHPRFRQDLSAQERQELTRLMNRVTHILGTRYAAVAFSPAWTDWQRVGHA